MFSEILTNEFCKSSLQVLRSSFLKPLDKDLSINIENGVLSTDNLLKIHNTDVELIMYICSEYEKLIDSQSDTFTKTHLCFMFANIVSNVYDGFMAEELNKHDADVSKFLEIKSGIWEFKKSDSIETMLDDMENLTDEDREARLDELVDGMEAKDALDVDCMDDCDGIEEQITDTYMKGIIED